MTSSRGLIFRAVVFVLMVCGFFASAIAIPDVLVRFAKLLPDNYAQNANALVRKGDFARAQRACERRIEQFSYDFTAHYMLADAYTRQNKFVDAARTIKSIIAKMPAARSNKGAALGYDEQRAYALLAGYLWSAGRFFESGEMARAAIDAGTPQGEFDQAAGIQNLKTIAAATAAGEFAIRKRDKVLFTNATQKLEDFATSDAILQSKILQARWSEIVDGESTRSLEILREAVAFSPRSPATRLALANVCARTGNRDEATSLSIETCATTGSKLLYPVAFKTGLGASATTQTMNIGRNGTVSVDISTGVFRVTNLLFNASGSQALAMFPVVIIKSGNEELTRIYVDSKQPRVYDLPLWPKGAPKNMELTFEFINDEYDPFTKADRNVALSNIILY